MLLDASLKSLFRYLLKYKRFTIPFYTVSALLELILAIISIKVPKLIQEFIDSLPLNSLDYSSLSDLAFIILIMGILISIVGALAHISTKIMCTILGFKLTNSYFQHILQLRNKSIAKFPAGKLISRLKSDFNDVLEFLAWGSLCFFKIIFMITYCIYSMMKINTVLTLIVIAIYCTSTLFTKIYRSLVMYKLDAVKKSDENLNQRICEYLYNMHYIKSQKAEKQFLNKAFEFAKLHYQNSISYNRAFLIIYPINRVLTSLSLLIIMFYGGHLVIKGDLSFGQITALMAYSSLIPYHFIAQFISCYINNKSALTRISEISKLTTENQVIKNKSESNHIKVFDFDKTPIVLSNVTFGYSSQKPVFKDLNLKIANNQIISIVGKNSSKKALY